jgi:type IV fimbrial biogenesis protein FimT
MSLRRNRGATLIELMFVVIVFVILVMIATPYLGTFIQRQRVKNAAMDIASTVAYARSEAIKRNAQIDVSAATAGWAGGWSVKVGTTTLRSYPALDRLQVTAGGSATSISFGGDGRMTTASQTFQVQPVESNSRQPPVCVTLGATGRVQTIEGSCS